MHMVMSRLSGDDRRSISRWIAKLGQYNRLTFKRKAKKARAELRLRYRSLGHGQHRLVYDLGNGCVLKVPISLRGMMCNELEHKLYASCAKPIKKHLCPVFGFGHGWILMRKMKAKVPFTRKYHKQLKLLRTKLRKAGIRPIDLKRANLAMYGGIIVVLDYGHFQAAHIELNKAAAKSVTKPVTEPAREPSITATLSLELPVQKGTGESMLTELIAAPEGLSSTIVSDPDSPIAEAEADSEPLSKALFPMKDDNLNF